MRVAQVERFGGPEVLVTAEAAAPVAGPGQAVVAVSAADVLFLETVVRRGEGGEYFPVQPPYVPGGAVAGRVSSVGNGVDSSWVGRRIVAGTPEGGYAEQVIAMAEDLIPVPDDVSLQEAAALFHDGRTALGLFEAAEVTAGEWVLVTAAGGGLGILLVQLAHAAGAHVIAAARGQQKLELARERGAETAVDYSEAGWEARVREATGGTGPSVVFDGAGGQIGRAAFEVTPSGGRFSAHGTPSGAFAEIDPQEAAERGVTVRGIEQVQFPPAEAKRLVSQALSEAAAGRITPVVGQTFSLERAADAHAAIESRDAIGKTLLVMQRKILVTGATGNVGKQVVTQLARAGAGVRALVRDNRAASFPPGVEVARGDLSDPASLDVPLRDVDAVFLVWPFLDSDGAEELLKVIKRHARRVVYLSAAGVDVEADEQMGPIHQFHAALERAVERTGLEWVFLRPFSFASNNLAWGDQIRAGVVRSAGASDVRALIHEADIAAVAVHALMGDELIGTRPELSGPEALTTAQQALAIGAALGQPVRFEEIPQEVARTQAIADGYPADLVEALFDQAKEFAPQSVTSTVEQITGRAPRTIRQWALDHAETFR